ncbi:IS481 family transposase [Micromonospora zamorensis]|uniref:IS481 family transposase n=1 Tax=Micromonospora zamorensis TaxID=709883 RepID=UPI002ED1EC4D|nr:IS481 family transposase [Micromonospora zamorensis]
MSVVEQRYRAVLAVKAGDRMGEVAAQLGVTRQSVHAWLRRYEEAGLAGLQDRSHRPDSCPHQASPEVEAAVCELRREHPRWGARRIAFELGRNGCPGPVPSRMTVYRILARHGLHVAVKRRRGRGDYVRWERARPMELWQMDIVGGILLADGTEAKVVTGVDDHSRFAVIAKVVRRATGRAVCLALAEGLARFGVPEELLTDNGKQFTDRFGKGGEVLFDRICRENGIVHRLTQPASPTTTGKVERFHQTLRRELLDDAGVFADLAAAQAAVDAFRHEYNTGRPRQSLDMAFPADRFRPATGPDQRLMPVKLPGFLTDAVGDPAPIASPVDLGAMAAVDDAEPPQPVGDYCGGPVEFDRVVPPSGNLQVAGKQFWLGPARSGVTVTFWADTDVIHLLIAGARIKSVRSHLSVTDLAMLARTGGRPAGPSPLPIDTAGRPGVVEVERTVSRSGSVSLGQHIILAAEILGGRRVGIRVDATTLTFFHLESRELLRTRPNPLTPDEVIRLRGARPAGPPPQPATGPTRVQRRASNSGVVMVVGQKVALGRVHAGKTVTIDVTDTTLTVECDDGPRTFRGPTTSRSAASKPTDHARPTIFRPGFDL